MVDGYCANLRYFQLTGNNFSTSGLNVLRRIIGPVARTAELNALSIPQSSINPQNTS